jgi:Fe-S cluster biogenesis protein NfuA
VRLDAPYYTEEELDALYETDPVAATRISREQHLLRKRMDALAAGADAAVPTWTQLVEVLEEARRILARDGGDLELVALDGTTVRVRLKGACTGCPRAPLDLRNVVESAVRRRYPAITAVVLAGH